MQEETLRASYLSHLRLVIEHILKHRIPKADWPQFLQRFDIEELRHILGIERGSNLDTFRVPSLTLLDCQTDRIPRFSSIQQFLHDAPFRSRATGATTPITLPAAMESRVRHGSPRTTAG